MRQRRISYRASDISLKATLLGNVIKLTQLSFRPSAARGEIRIPTEENGSFDSSFAFAQGRSR